MTRKQSGKVFGKTCPIRKDGTIIWIKAGSITFKTKGDMIMNYNTDMVETPKWETEQPGSDIREHGWPW